MTEYFMFGFSYFIYEEIGLGPAITFFVVGISWLYMELRDESN